LSDEEAVPGGAIVRQALVSALFGAAAALLVVGYKIATARPQTPGV
jgi:hypothetical protein